MDVCRFRRGQRVCKYVYHNFVLVMLVSFITVLMVAITLMLTASGGDGDEIYHNPVIMAISLS